MWNFLISDFTVTDNTGHRPTVYSCTVPCNKNNIFTFLITTCAWSDRDHKQYLHRAPVVHGPPVENPWSNDTPKTSTWGGWQIQVYNVMLATA